VDQSDTLLRDIASGRGERLADGTELLVHRLHEHRHKHRMSFLRATILAAEGLGIADLPFDKGHELRWRLQRISD
jgi:hypothetical protein